MNPPHLNGSSLYIDLDKIKQQHVLKLENKLVNQFCSNA